MSASWKKALSSIKDRTTIGIVKIASSRAPDLDVAIVKATSHDDMASDEKYVNKILHLTEISLSSAYACLQSLTKRIGKTRDWVVAIKVLIVIHRLLREGNPVFEDELKLLSKRSLNVSNFKDDSQSDSWDYSSFVRTYSAYLDARLDCFVNANTAPRLRSQHDENYGHFNSIRYSVNTASYDAENYNESSHRERKEIVKEMKPELLIEKLPNLQRMIDRVLACRPTGGAKNHRLVQISLYMIVRESFQIFSELCEGIGALLDVYFDMKIENCSRTFNIYDRFSKQSDALLYFYNNSKSMGICRPSEYPPVERVSPDYLEILEDFLAKRSGPHLSDRKSFIPNSEKLVVDHVTYESVYGVKALPAPPTETPSTISDQSTSSKTLEKEPDLIDLGNDDDFAATKDDKMALALVPSSSGENVTSGWATFDTPLQGVPQNSTTAAATQQKSASSDTKNIGLSGWELALVSEPSKSTNSNTSPTFGNFDRVRLDSLYNQSSVSSLPVFPRAASSFFALPAPGSSISHDPFSAAATFVLPANVQLADLPEKQRYLLQQQQQLQLQLWQQFQINEAYGNYGLTQFYSTPYAVPIVGSVRPQANVGVPYYGFDHGYDQSRR